MKIKDVAALARDARGVTLVNEKNETGLTTRQWLVIGGTAVYPLDGLPVLDENTLMAVLDVPMKMRDSYRVFTTELTDAFRRLTADALPGDRDAQMSGIEIGWEGVRMRCAAADDGSTVLVNTRWIKPVDDAKVDTTFAIRTDDNGQKTLIVKKGMLNVLCVGSADVWIDDKAAEELVRMARHAGRAAEKNRLRAADEGR